MKKQLQGDVALFLSTFCTPLDWVSGMVYQLSGQNWRRYPGLMVTLQINVECIIVVTSIEATPTIGARHRVLDKDISCQELIENLRECLDEVYKQREAYLKELDDLSLREIEEENSIGNGE